MDRILGRLIGIGIMGGGTGLVLLAILIFVALAFIAMVVGIVAL